jgi:hypothetical protein
MLEAWAKIYRYETIVRFLGSGGYLHGQGITRKVCRL